MDNKKVFLCMVCALAVAMVFVAANEAFAKEDRDERSEQHHREFADKDEHRPPHKFAEIRNRIEKLRAMSRQAEEKARFLWAEAEELERNLDRGFERRPRPEHMEQVHARLAELKEAAAHAEREGRHDEAAELHEKARRIAEEIVLGTPVGEAHAARGEERVPPELAQRLEELRHVAREAEERGEVEKAKRLLSEAEQLERKVRQEFERRVRRGAPERAEKMHRRLAELKEAAAHAERQGRHDEAAKLGEEAHKLAVQFEKTAHRDKIKDVGRQIERLHAMAAKAKEAGHHEKAEAILREAKSLEHRRKGRVEGAKEGPHVEALQHQIEMLREEVSRLRRDVEQLKHGLRGHDRPKD